MSGPVRWVMNPKHRPRCWVFMEHEQVELTNNQSERDVRTCVLQRKLSFGSKSEAGLRLMERLWTVGLTCQRQERSILDFITDSIVAHRHSQDAPPLILCPAFHRGGPEHLQGDSMVESPRHS